ncbi:hypothetical protein NVP1183O_28 [Vibrio phage 1.183.O._10N.286.48.B7]|nr:hypothetical protein NVP1183O_28 [Vibrio phage 1.183.O._10N.286.48.B7]
MDKKIKVTNTETGEEKIYTGTMMVAPNGMVFIKKDKRTIWCSAAVNFVAEEV